jgi:hypothetical protein
MKILFVLISHLDDTLPLRTYKFFQAEGLATIEPWRALPFFLCSKNLAGLRVKLAGMKVEAGKLREAMNLKGDEINFLCGHVAQLIQSISQLSLPPSQEEAKKKGWWQFWRRG